MRGIRQPLGSLRPGEAGESTWKKLLGGSPSLKTGRFEAQQRLNWPSFGRLKMSSRLRAGLTSWAKGRPRRSLSSRALGRHNPHRMRLPGYSALSSLISDPEPCRLWSVAIQWSGFNLIAQQQATSVGFEQSDLPVPYPASGSTIHDVDGWDVSIGAAVTDSSIFRTGAQSLRLDAAPTTPTITTAKLTLPGPLTYVTRSGVPFSRLEERIRIDAQGVLKTVSVTDRSFDGLQFVYLWSYGAGRA